MSAVKSLLAELPDTHGKPPRSSDSLIQLTAELDFSDDAHR